MFHSHSKPVLKNNNDFDEYDKPNLASNAGFLAPLEDDPANMIPPSYKRSSTRMQKPQYFFSNNLSEKGSRGTNRVMMAQNSLPSLVPQSMSMHDKKVQQKLRKLYKENNKLQKQIKKHEKEESERNWERLKSATLGAPSHASAYNGQFPMLSQLNMHQMPQMSHPSYFPNRPPVPSIRSYEGSYKPQHKAEAHADLSEETEEDEEESEESEEEQTPPRKKSSNHHREPQRHHEESKKRVYSSEDTSDEDRKEFNHKMRKMLRGNRNDYWAQQEELDRLKSKTQKEKDNNLKAMGILPINPYENTNLEVPDDDDELNELKDQNNKRKNMLNMKMQMAQRVSSMENKEKYKNFELKGYKKLKIYARCIYEFTKLMRFVREKWIKKEKEKRILFDESLDLYSDVAITWLISTIKTPIVNLMVQPKLNLDLTSIFVNSDKAFLKIKVRIEAIFKAITEEVIKKKVPLPLLEFLKLLITPRKYLPDDFFSMFERKRLSLNERGILSSASSAQECLIIGGFLLVRILLAKILLDPSSIVMIKLKKKQIRNFQIVSSVVYYLVLDYFKELLPIDKMKKLREEFDNIDCNQIMGRYDLSYFFNRQKKWMNDTKKSIGFISERIAKLAEKTQPK
ncbi:unnamed protein product [Moneuplotes crassus]|uniref:Uncharacterized protein n=1 Tax=Euplotes crassus TaxID=5936 RepID=A0AAD2CVK5_EUPCR|nr:unnamed protein product [Moneuplotes crassus]